MFKLVTSIRLLFNNSFMRFSFAMIPSTQLIAKDFAASPKSRILYKTFLIIKGLKTLISKCPLLPPTVIATF